jgi:hypothetical protein
MDWHTYCHGEHPGKGEVITGVLTYQQDFRRPCQLVITDVEDKEWSLTFNLCTSKKVQFGDVMQRSLMMSLNIGDDFKVSKSLDKHFWIRCVFTDDKVEGRP